MSRRGNGKGTPNSQDARGAALVALTSEREKLGRLEDDKAAAETELATLQAGAGEAVLDDPDAAGGLARQMQELRDRIDMTGRAVSAQRPRVAAAESAYLTAEADVLEQAALLPRAALRRHQARTEELLQALAEHECTYVPEHLLLDEQLRDSPERFTTTLEVPKSAALQASVLAAEMPVMVLREMAAGHDPEVSLRRAAGPEGIIGDRRPADFYPACVWGPDAVVPAPAYVRTVETCRARLREHRESLLPRRRAVVATLEAEVEQAEQHGDRRELREGPPGALGMSGKSLVDRLKIAQGKLEKVLADEQQIVAELAELTGEPEAVEPAVAEAVAS